MSNSLPNILLGHNPFFGVDHLSNERGNAKANRFEDPEKIVEILQYAHGHGVRGMMLSTHPRAATLAEALKNHPTLQKEWRFAPLVPYIQKYVRGANEKGLTNLVMETLGQATWGERFQLMLRGGAAALNKNLKQSLKLLVDFELLPLRTLPFGAVFLHDALVDLAIGLKAPQLLRLFQDHVQEKYGVSAGFITKNLPVFAQVSAEVGLESSWVMASFNARGFYVNPSLAEAEKTLIQLKNPFCAMNTLASGALPPEEAFGYLARFENLKSVVVGISRKESADRTLPEIQKKLWKR